MPINILAVVGARPNLMKIDPVLRALQREPERFSVQLVHTGQHYDDKMSRIFFRDLGLRPPDVDLGVGSGSHAEQTGKVMIRIERVLIERKPDLVMVVGDVNSTLAAALAAAKLHIPVAHVEAGLRSFDRKMPEEINRILTDALSTYLFTPSIDANENLCREGIAADRIYFVGNVMIDTLRRCLRLIDSTQILKTFDVTEKGYAVLTLHRPTNVDDAEVLEEILTALDNIQKALPILFPIHPRTEKRLKEFGFDSKVAAMAHLKITAPLGYFEFLALEAHAKLVLTDSGGIQEETTVLGVPCLTLRDSTERPVTLTHGTNQIVGHDKHSIGAAALAILNCNVPSGQLPEFWDGLAAERIVTVLREHAPAG